VPASQKRLPAGKGEVKLSVNGKEPWKIKAKFELEFNAAGGSVFLEAKPEGEAGEAKGVANFLLSEEELAARCSEGKGVKKLQFNASASGEL
jgi:hypothetical protein